MCVCVCVCERERGREREGEGEGGGGGERWRVGARGGKKGKDKGSLPRASDLALISICVAGGVK